MALATIESLRGLLGQEYATRDDALLSAILGAASDFFERECGRKIAVADYEETFDGNGTHGVILAASPVVAVTSVTVNGDTIPQRTAWDGTGWVLQGDRLRLVGSVYSRGVGNCVVSYRAGFDPIPEDVRMAVLEMAALKFRGRDSIGVFSRAVVGQEQVMYQTSTLPVQIQRVIDNYRVPPVL